MFVDTRSDLGAGAFSDVQERKLAREPDGFPTLHEASKLLWDRLEERTRDPFGEMMDPHFTAEMMKPVCLDDVLDRASHDVLERLMHAGAERFADHDVLLRRSGIRNLVCAMAGMEMRNDSSFMDVRDRELMFLSRNAAFEVLDKAGMRDLEFLADIDPGRKNDDMLSREQTRALVLNELHMAWETGQEGLTVEQTRRATRVLADMILENGEQMRWLKEREQRAAQAEAGSSGAQCRKS